MSEVPRMDVERVLPVEKGLTVLVVDVSEGVIRRYLLRAKALRELSAQDRVDSGVGDGHEELGGG